MSIDLSKVDLDAMSEYTGISVKMIQSVFGDRSELQEASTPEEARAVYNKTPDGSEIEKAALEKWGQLCQEELDKASTPEEARAVYNKTPDGSEVRKAALEKWGQLCQEELDKASTPEEARDVYNKTPDGSEIEKAALEKLTTFFPKE